MAVVKLEVRNFLSIQSATVNIPQGLIAIVGRNGCGKSNLLHAFAFVLNSSGPGIGSLKSLRCNDVKEVSWLYLILSVEE
jgi:AAA15 family ATPase/GTPase